MTNITITDIMCREAYFVFRNNHAMENTYYPIALEIYEQIHGNNYTEEFPVPFPWDMPKDIMKKVEQISEVLWKEYRRNYYNHISNPHLFNDKDKELYTSSLEAYKNYNPSVVYFSEFDVVYGNKIGMERMFSEYSKK